MMADLEERIIAFTAEETGMEPEKICLESRLLHDIGVDGDDAVEFFQHFEETFHVDLTTLWANWKQHFGPETGVSPAGVAFIGVAVGVAGVLHELVQVVPLWAWCIPLVPAACWFAGRLVGVDPRIVRVTIEDLVMAARAGKWAR